MAQPCSSHVNVALAAIVCALPAATPTYSEASHGNYCGGEGLWHPGQPIDLPEWCRHKYGSSATAVAVKQDAYGWVCRAPGKADVGINVHDACHRKYGSDAALMTS